MKIHSKKTLFTMFAVFSVLALIQLATIMSGHRFILNLSNSEPIGVYRLLPFNGNPEKGDLVLMNAPENARSYIYGRGWLPDGWPLLKTVGAIPGDMYCVSDGSLTINGTYAGPVFKRDSEGLPLPWTRGCRQVETGHFLPVASNSATSFDGRYFGTVSESEIRAFAIPVFTFQE